MTADTKLAMASDRIGIDEVAIRRQECHERILTEGGNTHAKLAPDTELSSPNLQAPICAKDVAWSIGATSDSCTSPVLDASVLVALKTPRERNFLLKLESHIINNLKNDKIEKIKLTTPMPPNLRFLVHLVAEYFGLQHIVDQKSGEKQKATMTLLKTSGSLIPPQTLSAICEDLDKMPECTRDAGQAVLAESNQEAAVAAGSCAAGAGDSDLSPEAEPDEQSLPVPDGAASACAAALPQPSPEAHEAEETGAQLQETSPVASPPREVAEGSSTVRAGRAPPRPLRILRKEDHAVGGVLPVVEEGAMEDAGECPSDDAAEQAPLPEARAEGDAAQAAVADGRTGDRAGTAEDARDVEDSELISRPAPVVIPGKFKIIQRRDIAEDAYDPHARHGDDASRRDPSRMPLEEREQAYLQARARIFGGTANNTEAVPEPTEPQKAEDPQVAQRRAAMEMRLAQEKMSALRDPAYNRALSYVHTPLGSLAGRPLSLQAAPTDTRSLVSDLRSMPVDPRSMPVDPRSMPVDPRTANMEGARTALAGQQALLAAAAAAQAVYPPAPAFTVWRAPHASFIIQGGSLGCL